MGGRYWQYSFDVVFGSMKETEIDVKKIVQISTFIHERYDIFDLEFNCNFKDIGVA